MNNTKSMSNSKSKDVAIRYGDSRIEVTNKLHVSKKNDKAFIVILHPEKGYEDREVHLIGKDGSDWPNIKLSEASGGRETRVDITELAEKEYTYTVKIEGLGEIDPRITVEL
jgi:hypothetical protein